MLVFGKRLRELRKNKELTQQEVATQIHVTKGTISFYENGKRRPPYEKIIDLADFFKVDIQYFLGNDYQVYSNEERGNIFNMAQDEVELVKELRKHISVYEKMIENPRRVIDFIEKVMK